VARFAQGVAAGFAWVASMSLIAAATPSHRRGQAFGVAMSAISVGLLIGPPAAGALVGALGTAAPFLLAALLALVDGVLRIVLVRDDPRPTDDVAGPAAVLRVPGTVAVATGVAIGALLLAAVEPILPVELAGRHGTGPVGIGLLFGVAVLTSIAANLVVGHYTATANPRLVLGGGLVVGVVALALIALGPTLWLVGVGMGLLGVGSAAILVPATTLIGLQGERVSPPTIGGAYALFNLAYAGGMTVGPLLAGPAVEVAGFGAAVLVVAGVTAVVGAVAAVRLPGLGDGAGSKGVSGDPSERAAG
jgi:MFS family permease